MSYLVKNLMTKDINTIDHDATVTEAAEIMAADKHLGGYVIVLDKGKPVGIITERDIVNRVIAKKFDPEKMKTAEIMSTPIITVDPDEEILEASKLMEDNKVRNLVVVKNGIIYGVIKAKDIALHCRNYLDQSVNELLRWTHPFSV